MNPRDWEYICDLGRRRGCSEHWLREVIEEALAYPFRKEMHQQGPLDYQDMAYVIARIHAPDKVLETGVRHGVCTSFLLAALDMSNAGLLTSVEPMWKDQKTATRGIIDLIFTPAHYFDRWEFYSGLSQDVLPDLGHRKFDLFVHDSDHGYQNMMWELEWAWEHGVKPGGIIICDDWDWQENDELHLHKDGNVLEQFCKQRGCEFHTIGTAAVIEVPM